MISLIQLPHRSRADLARSAKAREVLAGITIGLILLFQIGLVVWALLKEWRL